MNQTQAIKALRDALQFFIDRCDSGMAVSKTTYAKFKEVLALTADASEDAPDDADDYAIMQMGKLLAEIAIVMKGKEKPLHRHSYHDLPELVSIMACELEIYHATYGTTIPASDAARTAPVGAGMAVEKCDGCRGYGMVGNIIEQDTCPFCQGSGEAAAPAAPTENDDDLFYPPKAALKREDWNAVTRKPKVNPSSPASSTPLCPARKVECGQNPQQWCATCPEWEKARSSPMAAVQAKPEAALQALADQAQELGLGYGPDKAEAVEQAGGVEECTLCNGMGFIDGAGSICPHCDGSGIERQAGAEKKNPADADSAEGGTMLGASISQQAGATSWRAAVDNWMGELDVVMSMQAYKKLLRLGGQAIAVSATHKGEENG